MYCFKFPAKDCNLLTCQYKGRCLYKDEEDAQKQPDLKKTLCTCEDKTRFTLISGYSYCNRCGLRI